MPGYQLSYAALLKGSEPNFRLSISDQDSRDRFVTHLIFGEAGGRDCVWILQADVLCFVGPEGYTRWSFRMGFLAQ